MKNLSRVSKNKTEPALEELERRKAKSGYVIGYIVVDRFGKLPIDDTYSEELRKSYSAGTAQTFYPDPESAKQSLSRSYIGGDNVTGVVKVVVKQRQINQRDNTVKLEKDNFEQIEVLDPRDRSWHAHKLYHAPPVAREKLSQIRSLIENITINKSWKSEKNMARVEIHGKFYDMPADIQRIYTIATSPGGNPKDKLQEINGICSQLAQQKSSGFKMFSKSKSPKKIAKEIQEIAEEEGPKPKSK